MIISTLGILKLTLYENIREKNFQFFQFSPRILMFTIFTKVE